jgi:Fe-S-cluster containining protein
MSASAPVDAGEFGAWLDEMRTALLEDRDTEVACGTCVGCCTSSLYIVLRPADARVLPHVPAEYVVESPRLPAGQRVMGYDARGHCPMLRDGKCTVYALRPQTCRTFDCRIFAAAGIDAGGPDKAPISTQARRWEFTYASEEARRAHAAIRAAAQFMRNDATSFPPGAAPSRPAEVAVAALQTYELFLDGVPDSREEREALAHRVLAARRAAAESAT